MGYSLLHKILEDLSNFIGKRKNSTGFLSFDVQYLKIVLTHQTYNKNQFL